MVSLSRQLALISVTGFVMACLASPVWAADGMIRAIQFDPASQHFTINATGPVRATLNTITIGGHRRVIVDVDNAEIALELPRDSQLLQDMSRQMPALRNVTVNQYGGNGRPIVRILFDIDGDLRNVRLVRNQGSRLELEVNDAPVRTQAVASRPEPPVPQRIEPTSSPQPYSWQQSAAPQPPAQPAEVVSRAVYNQTVHALEDQKRQIDDLQRQIGQLSAANQQAQHTQNDSAIDDLKRTVSSLNQKYESLAQENQYLKARFATPPQAEPTSDNQDLSKDLTNAKAENERLKKLSANLQSQLDTLASNQSATEASGLAAKDEQIADLQSQLTVAKRRMEALTREMQTVKQAPTEDAAKAAADAAIAAKQAEITRLRQNNQSLQSQLQQALDAAKNTSGVGVDEMKRTLVTMNQKYDRLTLDNQNLKAQVLKLQSTPMPSSTNNALVVAKQAEIDQLKQSNQQLQAKLRQAQTASPTGAASSPTTLSDADLQKLRRQLTVAQQSLNDSIGTINQQNKEIAYLRNQVDSMRGSMDASGSTEKDSRIRDLERQLAAAKTSTGSSSTGSSTDEVAALRRQISQMSLQYKNSLDTLGKQLTAKSQQADEQERQLTEAREEIQTAQMQAGTLQRQVTSMRPKSGGDAEIQKRDNQIMSLQLELDRAKRQQENMKMELEAARQGGTQSVSSLKAEIARLNAENQNLVTQQLNTKTALASARQDGTQSVSSLKAEIARLNTENQNLKSQQATAKTVLESARQGNQSIASLKAEIAQLTSENQALKDRQSTARTQTDTGSSQAVASLKSEVARLTMENQSLKTANQKFAEENGESIQPLQAKITQLESQLSGVNSQYKQAIADAQKAQLALEAQKHVMVATAKPGATLVAGSAALQKQVTDLNRQLADARRENTGLKDRLSSVTGNASRQPSSNAEAEKDYADAKAAMTAGDITKALDNYKEAQLLDPDNSRFTIDYSIALAENHQYADAADLLRRYLQRNPGDKDAYNQLGKVYLLNDQTDAAAQAFSRAISVSTLNNYATSLKKQGKLDDSESIFKIALKLNPNDSEVLFNLGNLYNATNKLEQARNNYLQAIQIKPDFAEAHYNLGLIYSKLGDKAQAVSHLEKFLQLSPNAKNAETIRAYVEKLKA